MIMCKILIDSKMCFSKILNGTVKTGVCWKLVWIFLSPPLRICLRRPEFAVAWPIEVQSKNHHVNKDANNKEIFCSRFVFDTHLTYIWCSLLQGFFVGMFRGIYSLFIYSPTVSKFGTESTNFWLWCMLSSNPPHSGFSI